MKHLSLLLCLLTAAIVAEAQALRPQWGWYPPVETQLDSQTFTLQARPHLWWNGFAGLQPGLALEGGRPGHQVALLVSYNTGLLTQPSPEGALERFADSFPRWNYALRYSVPLSLPAGSWQLGVESAFRDGLHRHGLWLSQRVAGREPGRVHTFTGGYRYLLHRRNATRDYLLLPDRWNTGRPQAYVWGTYTWQQAPDDYRQQRLRLTLRASAPGSAAAYGWLESEWTGQRRWQGFDLRGRAYARYGTGTPPLESRLYLAGGSPEEMWEEPLLRARGWVPAAWLETDLGQRPHHLHYGGGLNLRGYAGYRAEFADAEPAWLGNSGAALNLEIGWDRWIKLPNWRLRRYLDLDAYGFYDVGVMARGASPGRTTAFTKMGFDKIRQNAGLGLALRVSNWAFFHTDPLVLRFDAPFFLSNPPFDTPFIAPRWVVSVGRAF